MFGIGLNIIWRKITNKGNLNIHHWPKLIREIEEQISDYLKEEDLFSLYINGEEQRDMDYSSIQEIAKIISILFIFFWLDIIILAICATLNIN